MAGLSTGSLSGPGFTIQESVSREHVESALKAFQDAFRQELRVDVQRELEGGIRRESEKLRSALRAEFRDELDEIKRQVKGKAADTGSPVVSSTIPSLPLPQPFFSPPPPGSDLTTDDLKSLLLSRLLDESSFPTEEGIELISLLRQQTTPSTADAETLALRASLAERDARLAQRDEEIRLLRAQILSLENTCREQADSLKRRHDDQDDPDRHEGEKRRRIESSSGAAATSTSEQTTTSIQPETESTPHNVESQVDPIEPTGHDVDTTLSLTSAEVSLDVGPTVEKPAGGDTELLGDEDDDIFEDWPLINLDAPQSADTELVINERARQLLLELASSYVPFTGLPDFDRFIMGEAGTASTSEPTTTETSASDPPLRGVADRPPTPFATRPSRQRPTRLPLPPLQRVQTFVFTPFLEETYSSLFRREIYVYPDELKYGVKEMKNRRRQTEYIHIRKGSGSHRQERIRRQFVAVVDIRERPFVKHSFCEYVVAYYGCSGEWFTFWEGEFDSIDLEDLLALIHDLRSNHDRRPGIWIRGLEALKRYVRHAITLARVEDFQLTLESDAPMVNLTMPDLSCPSIQTSPPFTPLYQPETGIIYLNGNGERRFMRLSQLDRFSDGTLLLVRNILVERLTSETFVTLNRFDVERTSTEHIVKEITKRLRYRLQIRRVEMANKLRAKTITVWEEYRELSYRQPGLQPPPPS
jgi:hypothetical protein